LCGRFCYNPRSKRNPSTNNRLDEALTKVRAPSDDKQQEVAEFLFEYVEMREAGTWLTLEQVEESSEDWRTMGLCNR
jgi:hypothetical protein